MWLDELKGVGLTGGKDGSAVDVPPETGTVPVDVRGQKIEIKLDAYGDEDGDLRTEVREHPAKTDLGILGVLAAMEGGAPDPQRIWADYERLFEGREPERRDKFIPVPTESEKVLMLAQALLEYRDASAFAELTDQQRRERVVSVARRVAKAHKAIREISADLETGTLWTRVEDAQRDVKAAELRDLQRVSQ